MTEEKKYLELQVGTQAIKVPVDLVAETALSMQAEKAASDLTITNDQEAAKATDMLGIIVGRKKELEQSRKNYVTPFNDFVSRVNSMFKPIATGLENAERKVKEKLIQYRNHREQLRLEEEERRQKEFEKQLKKEERKAEKKGMEPVYVPPPLPIAPTDTTIKSASGSATFKKIWTATIEDARKIPMEYYLAQNVQDELLRNLKALARSTKGQVPVPGVKFWQDETISGRNV
jgi:hypothetical protein